jgi:DNA topoisomerase-1
MPPLPRGLVYVTDQARGIRRVRLAGGKRDAPPRFHYFGPKGKRIRDTRTLARIAALAIPPAYEEVWICANPRGHLQATGRDARGRKQYRYHPEWRAARDDHKHSRMRSFGAALGRLRAAVRRDLKLPGLPREKVLALVVRLLDATQVRVGNVEYARSNGSFGLTTLRDRHARFPGRGKALLQFRGKGGAEHDVLVDDQHLAKLVRRCVNAVVKEVASGLRNTPAVCRKSYINPAVFIAWQNGELRRRAARGQPAKALLTLLRREHA